jgi:hypothetical protein
VLEIIFNKFYSIVVIGMEIDEKDGERWNSCGMVVE